MKITQRVSLLAAAVLVVAPMANAFAGSTEVCEGAYRLVGTTKIDWSGVSDYPPLIQTVTLAPGKTSVPPSAYRLSTSSGYREETGELRDDYENARSSGQRSFPAKPLHHERHLFSAQNCKAFHSSTVKASVVCRNGKTEQVQITNEFADCRQAGG